MPFMLGKLPPKLDRRTLKLAKYTTSELAPPPLQAGYIAKVAKWPMMLNDVEGDCTFATVGHLIQVWTTNATPPGTIPSDADIQFGYSDLTGYDPSDPSTDNGAVELDVLNYWRQKGVGGHKIIGYALVNSKNIQEIKQTVYLFGGAYIGVSLPISAQADNISPDGRQTWAVPATGLAGDGVPGSWGGHAVPIVAYDESKAVVVSWGSLVDVTWDFITNYCDEAYAVLSQEWVDDNDGLSPSGLKMDQLTIDLELVTR